jgi:hypothetical protein
MLLDSPVFLQLNIHFQQGIDHMHNNKLTIQITLQHVITKLGLDSLLSEYPCISTCPQKAIQVNGTLVLQIMSIACLYKIVHILDLDDIPFCVVL